MEKTKAELIEMCEKMGIKVLARDTLADLKRKIEESDEPAPTDEEVPVEDAPKPEPPKKRVVKLEDDPVPAKLDIKEEHEIYAALAAPLPEKAVERTSAGKTGKGYDTTGYKYQYVVNRFNEILGLTNWWFTFHIEDVRDTKTQKGYAQVQVSVSTAITIRIGDREVTKVLSGGHTSNNYADALKGAITNSFKKTAALYGVGKAAYQVTIDDDNRPATTNEHGTKPSASGYTPQGKGFVTPKMAAAIATMAGSLNINQEAWKQKLGIESYYKLPFEKGSKIIDMLKAKIEEKNKEPEIQIDEPEEDPLADIEVPADDLGMTDEEADALLNDV